MSQSSLVTTYRSLVNTSTYAHVNEVSGSARLVEECLSIAIAL